MKRAVPVLVIIGCIAASAGLLSQLIGQSPSTLAASDPAAGPAAADPLQLAAKACECNPVECRSWCEQCTGACVQHPLNPYPWCGMCVNW